MRQTCLNVVYELAKHDPRIVFIGSDLGQGTLDKFKQEMPDRFFMEGISEAHCIGMAAGMAMEGSIVYVNTIATFLTRRCFEQIVLDLCLHKLKVRLIANGGGVVYAPLGPTHLATDDLAILRAVPNLTIIAPSDANEMRRIMPLTVDYPGPIYIRVAKGGDPIVSRETDPLAIGKGISMRDGKDALIVCTGITLKPALDAHDLLQQQGIAASVLHLPTVKPLDHEQLVAKTSAAPIIVTVEEHNVTGGIGSAVAELISEQNYRERKFFQRIGIPDVFPDHYGSQANLMTHYGITAENVVATVKKFHAQLTQR